MTSLCSIIHVLGWLISVLAYTISLFIPYPEPYYQVANCTLDNTVVNNPDAPNAGMYYVAIMAVGVFGVGITDLASDALVVDYVKREPLKHRGRINIFAAMCNTFGGVLLLLVIGVLLNSPAYGGRFCSLNFTFRDILMILLCISVLGFFNSSFMTFETETKKIKVDLMETVHKFWSFMHYRVFQRCALLFILVPSLYNAKTSANVKIRKNWAKVEPFYGSMIGVAVALLVIVGMYVLQRWFLHVSWKKLYSYTKLMIVGVSVVVEGLTIFDWVRSQYFYFSEDLLTSVAQAACAFIMLQLAAEVSEKGLEALTFGMLMTNWTISACFSVIIGNIISAPFQVNDDDRYLRDSLEDRWAVFGSVLATSFVNILAIPFFVLLCPSDRSQVKSLKESLGKSKPQAQIYAATFCVGYMFIFVFNALIMFPQTQCYQILGGKGCKI
ncbi:uncharacterized protein LOC134855553 isoform X2 [Symsagittifera roscoffensis]|uniref:uncharacterized protein LOC134855553 isoform X2 n=1 Tax=Symsagittifera roscoffensis TaxID=84072 RepID=UPI00307C1A42